MTPHAHATYSAVHRIGHGPPTYFGHHRANNREFSGQDRAILRKMAKAKSTPAHELKEAVYKPQPEEVEAIVERLKVAEFGLSTASLAHQLGRRGDVRIRKICQWMEAEGVLVSSLANRSPIEIWELKTPEAVKRAEVRFR